MCTNYVLCFGIILINIMSSMTVSSDKLIPKGTRILHKNGETHELTKYIIVPDNYKEIDDKSNEVNLKDQIKDFQHVKEDKVKKKIHYQNKIANYNQNDANSRMMNRNTVFNKKVYNDNQVDETQYSKRNNNLNNKSKKIKNLKTNSNRITNEKENLNNTNNEASNTNRGGSNNYLDIKSILLPAKIIKTYNNILQQNKEGNADEKDRSIVVSDNISMTLGKEMIRQSSNDDADRLRKINQDIAKDHIRVHKPKNIVKNYRWNESYAPHEIIALQNSRDNETTEIYEENESVKENNDDSRDKNKETVDAENSTKIDSTTIIYDDETRKNFPDELTVDLSTSATERFNENESRIHRNDNITESISTISIQHKDVKSGASENDNKIEKNSNLRSSSITHEQTEINGICKNSEFLIKILTTIIRLLKHDTSEKSSTSYVLEILKDLLKASPEAVHDYEVMYKINDLLSTLEKYHEKDTNIQNSLRTSDKGLTSSDIFKSTILWKYEIPYFQNPKCTAELFTIIKVVQEALLRLVNNPICKSEIEASNVPFLTNVGTLLKNPNINPDKFNIVYTNLGPDTTIPYLSYPKNPPNDKLDLESRDVVLINKLKPLFPKETVKQEIPILEINLPKNNQLSTEKHVQILPHAPASFDVYETNVDKKYPVYLEPEKNKPIYANTIDNIFPYLLPNDMTDSNDSLFVYDSAPKNSNRLPYYISTPKTVIDSYIVPNKPFSKPVNVIIQETDKLNPFNLIIEPTNGEYKPVEEVSNVKYPNVPIVPSLYVPNFNENILTNPDPFYSISDELTPSPILHPEHFDKLKKPYYSPIDINGAGSQEIGNFREFPVDFDINIPIKLPQPYSTLDTQSDKLTQLPFEATDDKKTPIVELDLLTKKPVPVLFQDDSQMFPFIQNQNPPLLQFDVPENRLKSPIENYLHAPMTSYDFDIGLPTPSRFDVVGGGSGVVQIGEKPSNIYFELPSSTIFPELLNENTYVPIDQPSVTILNTVPIEETNRPSEIPNKYDKLPNSSPMINGKPNISPDILPNFNVETSDPNPIYTNFIPDNKRPIENLPFEVVGEGSGEILINTPKSVIEYLDLLNPQRPKPNINLDNDESRPIYEHLPNIVNLYKRPIENSLFEVGGQGSGEIPINSPKPVINQYFDWTYHRKPKPNLNPENGDYRSVYTHLPNAIIDYKRPLVNPLFEVVEEGLGEIPINTPKDLTNELVYLQRPYHMPFYYDINEESENTLPNKISNPDILFYEASTPKPPVYYESLPEELTSLNQNMIPELMFNQQINNNMLPGPTILSKDNIVLANPKVSYRPDFKINNLPYVLNQVEYSNNQPMFKDTKNTDNIPDIYLPGNPQLSSPDKTILVIIKENLDMIERIIPKMFLDSAIQKHIALIKELMHLKKVTIEEYITILNQYEALIEYIKRLNIDNEILNDLISSVTNGGKLDFQYEKSKVVELTYLVKRPTPLIYQPYYYIKYRLPYVSFVTQMETILDRKPYLRSRPSQLYKSLIPVSNIAETSPDLKSYNTDDIVKLTFNNGTLVGTKIVKGNDIDMYASTLDMLKTINNEITIEDVNHHMNNLATQLKTFKKNNTSDVANIKSNLISYNNGEDFQFTPNVMDKTVKLTVNSNKNPSIFKQTTRVTSKKVTSDEIIAEILKRVNRLRLNNHENNDANINNDVLKSDSNVNTVYSIKKLQDGKLISELKEPSQINPLVYKLVTDFTNNDNTQLESSYKPMYIEQIDELTEHNTKNNSVNLENLNEFSYQNLNESNNVDRPIKVEVQPNLSIYNKLLDATLNTENTNKESIPLSSNINFNPVLNSKMKKLIYMYNNDKSILTDPKPKTSTYYSQSDSSIGGKLLDATLKAQNYKTGKDLNSPNHNNFKTLSSQDYNPDYSYMRPQSQSSSFVNPSDVYSNFDNQYIMGYAEQKPNIIHYSQKFLNKSPLQWFNSHKTYIKNPQNNQYQMFNDNVNNNINKIKYNPKYFANLDPNLYRNNVMKSRDPYRGNGIVPFNYNPIRPLPR